MSGTNSNIQVMKDLSGYLTEKQMLLLYRSADKWRDRLIIRLLWKTGRRITEVLRLKVKDIDFAEMRILWNIIKKKKPYKAWKPIDEKTIDLLGWYIDKIGLQKDHYVLNAGWPDKPITRQRAFQIIRRVGKLAGIETVGEKRIHPHHFRHGFCVALSKKLKSPSDVEKLRRIMEHSNLGVTQVYLQFGDEELRELIED